MKYATLNKENGAVEIREGAVIPSGAYILTNEIAAALETAPDRAAMDAILTMCEVMP